MATTTNTDKDPSVLNENSGNRETSGASKSKLKSRSLEPLTSLAMWCEEIIQIELVKGDRGLGFSILDYQDPMNKEETVVVIRSLVPGGEIPSLKGFLDGWVYYLEAPYIYFSAFHVGVAQQDGRLIPGDRLMYVNDVKLAHASLDEAVQALKVCFSAHTLRVRGESLQALGFF